MTLEEMFKTIAGNRSRMRYGYVDEAAVRRMIHELRQKGYTRADLVEYFTPELTYDPEA